MKQKQHCHQISIIKHSIDKIQQKKELIKKAYLAEIDTLEEYKANKIELQKEEKELLKKLSLLEIQQQSPHDILNPKRLQMFYNIKYGIYCRKTQYSYRIYTKGFS